MNNHLKSYNIRQTKLRLALINLFSSANKPLPVREIFKELNKNGIRYDQASVFRSLDVFCEKRLCKRVYFSNSLHSYYEINLNDHHHFTCDSCGLILEINNCFLDKKVTGFAKQKGLIIKGHFLEFNGICSHCQSIG